VIVVENLAVKNMVKNHNLAKAINDAGWGMFCTMLKYKAEFDGKTYLEIGRFFPSSHLCSNSHLAPFSIVCRGGFANSFKACKQVL
jgi:putative transposase